MNESTRETVKSMIEGMMYHANELAKFMAKTVRDPYFETEEGQTIRRAVVGILSSHLTAVATLLTSKEKDVDKNKFEKIGIEDLLNDSFK